MVSLLQVLLSYTVNINIVITIQSYEYDRWCTYDIYMVTVMLVWWSPVVCTACIQRVLTYIHAITTAGILLYCLTIH
jgi:hypothetical protein